MEGDNSVVEEQGISVCQVVLSCRLKKSNFVLFCYLMF